MFSSRGSQPFLATSQTLASYTAIRSAFNCHHLLPINIFNTQSSLMQSLCIAAFTSINASTRSAIPPLQSINSIQSASVTALELDTVGSSIANRLAMSSGSAVTFIASLVNPPLQPSTLLRTCTSRVSLSPQPEPVTLLASAFPKPLRPLHLLPLSLSCTHSIPLFSLSSQSTSSASHV